MSKHQASENIVPLPIRKKEDYLSGSELVLSFGLRPHDKAEAIAIGLPSG